MKKVLLGFFILCLLLTSVKASHAQKTTPSPTVPAMINEAVQKPQEATEQAKVQYNLPYPGILPDNPLHFLKALRDRIILFLISDQAKEAEFNLLTSDKRIYAAQMLADRGKDTLSISTLSKSNNYFHNAITSVIEAKKMGKRVDIVLDSMKKSIIKHQEVLSLIEKTVDEAFSDQLQIEGKRMIEFEKTVDNLALK